MIINQWTVLVLAICYFCSYQAKGDVQTNNVNKLDFWQREPKVNDTRRLQKKQTRSEKYPRRFQAVHYGNELHEIASSDQDNTEELSTAKNESRSEKNSKNLIVQEYGKEDKFKKKKQKASKTTRKKARPRDEHGATTLAKQEHHTTKKESDEDKAVPISPYGIIPQMTKLLESFENVNVSSEILGRTSEFNDIVLFKISAMKNDSKANFRTLDGHKYDDENPEKRIIFIVHGLTVMGLATLSCLRTEKHLKILLGYYMKHLDKFDIFIIPIANPDGYVRIQQNGKVYWNKNMSPQTDCRGVALDRNFDVAWNDSHDLSSCNPAYPGPVPLSEVESKAISNVFHFHGHRIIAYIHVHAGTYDTDSFKGEAVLYPRGYTDTPGDDDKYLDIKGEIDESMRNASFQVMGVTVDSLYHWYGKVTGTSVDYASQVFGITYAMEFVMQLYENDMFAVTDEDSVDYIALTEIWGRIIEVVFTHIGKAAGFVKEEEHET